MIQKGFFAWRTRLGLLAAALVALPAAFYSRTAWLAWRDLHPPRVLPDQRLAGQLGARAVAYFTADQVRISAWYRAPGTAGATVLLLHGHGENRDQMVPQAAALVAAGYGVLLPDLRRHGTSGGLVATSGALEPRDVEAALAWLRAQPEQAGARILAIGFSVGGMALAQVAAHDPGIAAVVLESTPATLADNLAADTPRDRPFERRLYAWVHEHYSGTATGAVRPIDQLCAIAPRPLLLTFGEHDAGIPPAQRTALAAAACGPVQSWTAPGSGHADYVMQADTGLLQRVLPFLRGVP